MTICIYRMPTYIQIITKSQHRKITQQTLLQKHLTINTVKHANTTFFCGFMSANSTFFPDAKSDNRTLFPGFKQIIGHSSLDLSQIIGHSSLDLSR